MTHIPSTVRQFLDIEARVDDPSSSEDEDETLGAVVFIFFPFVI